MTLARVLSMIAMVLLIFQVAVLAYPGGPHWGVYKCPPLKNKTLQSAVKINFFASLGIAIAAFALPLFGVGNGSDTSSS